MLFVLFSLSLGIVFYGRTHSSAIEDARMAINDTLAPVINTLAKPMDAMHGVGEWVNEMVSLRAENIRLRAENERLMRWQATASELGSENQRLKSLLNFAPPMKSSYISARISVDAGNPFSRSVVIGAGISQGIADDAAVVNENGLIGRVVGVGQKTSRVLLLTDINSRIPVIGQKSREHAIAGGTGGDSLSLLYLTETSRIKEGEVVVTSGDGSVLPAGIPIGVVTSVNKGAASVQTFADWHSLEYVSVLDVTK